MQFTWMEREPEPELMDVEDEANAYASADFAEVNNAFVERLLDLAGRLDNPRALDLGTGPGDIPIRIHLERPTWRIAALDGSFAMLHIGRRTARQAPQNYPIQWVLSNAKQPPFRTGSFDVIFSNSILHHITHVERFWAELKRIAKPGALVFLRDLARPSTTEAARQIVGQYAANESRLLQQEYYRSLLSAYTPDEVRRQLAAADLPLLNVAMVTDRHLDVWGHTTQTPSTEYASG